MFNIILACVATRLQETTLWNILDGLFPLHPSEVFLF